MTATHVVELIMLHNIIAEEWEKNETEKYSESDSSHLQYKKWEAGMVWERG